MITRLKKHIRTYRQDPFFMEECADLEACLTDKPYTHSEFIFEPGQYIYMTGFSGEKGTDIISSHHKTLIEELPDRSVYGNGYSFINIPFSGSYVINVGERGVFQSLFDLHEISGLGFEVNSDLIPISPYTCAVTDLLGLDPFRLLSTDCSIMIVPEDKNRKTIERIQYAEISGVKGYPVKIGHLTNDCNMKIMTGDNVSLLNRTKRDEFFKILDNCL